MCQVTTHPSVANGTTRFGQPSIAGAPDTVSVRDGHCPRYAGLFPWPTAILDSVHAGGRHIPTRDHWPQPGLSHSCAAQKLAQTLSDFPTSLLSRGPHRSLDNAHAKSDERGSAGRPSGVVSEAEDVRDTEQSHSGESPRHRSSLHVPRHGAHPSPREPGCHLHSAQGEATPGLQPPWRSPSTTGQQAASGEKAIPTGA